ncbi:MAG: hypothetical protein AAB090_05225 [Nitrospirota bacterium]
MPKKESIEPPEASSSRSRREDEIAERCCSVRRGLAKGKIYADLNEGPATGNDLWRISPEPFWISEEDHSLLVKLGNALLSFYESSNRLYFESIDGKAPSWVAGYLDQGKPDAVISYGRMNRFRSHLPGVLRPDIILTDGGMIITELDSVPGGIGITGALCDIYSSLGFKVIGDNKGMVNGFARMVRSFAGKEDVSLAIIVSEESASYRKEMRWLASELMRGGFSAYVIAPGDVIFTEDGLFLDTEGRKIRIEVVYRFFELFDLKNIPKSELIIYAAKKKKVLVTPPLKAFLEEKMLIALFHHPLLRSYWIGELGEEAFGILFSLFPRTWIMDQSVVPPYAVIPDLYIGGRPVSDWRAIGTGTQKERRFVIKPSGFSELAWGSRGVTVGHDLSEEEWSKGIDGALKSFPRNPYVLQEFHKGKIYESSYLDQATNSVMTMEGRVRLSPYYFVIDGKAELAGIMATICPKDKKLIHGMMDAVIVPCGSGMPFDKAQGASGELVEPT